MMLRTEFICPYGGRPVIADYKSGSLSLRIKHNGDDAQTPSPPDAVRAFFAALMARRYRSQEDAELALRQAGVAADQVQFRVVPTA
jgi:hypothetical protein